MKKLAFLSSLALLAGCSGTVDSNNPSGGGAGGGTTSSTGTESSGGTGATGGGGAGGEGGLFAVGGGSSTTSSTQEGCSITLDEEGFHVSLVVGGESITLGDPCEGGDGFGPDAYELYGKSLDHVLHVRACGANGALPHLTIDVGLPQPDGVTTIEYTTEPMLWKSTAASVTFTNYGAVWQEITGTFDGKLAGQDGSEQLVDGKFKLCRRPDLAAP